MKFASPKIPTPQEMQRRGSRNNQASVRNEAIRVTPQALQKPTEQEIIYQAESLIWVLFKCTSTGTTVVEKV